jgi:hypothetical protein
MENRAPACGPHGEIYAVFGHSSHIEIVSGLAVSDSYRRSLPIKKPEHRPVIATDCIGQKPDIAGHIDIPAKLGIADKRPFFRWGSYNCLSIDAICDAFL